MIFLVFVNNKTNIDSEIRRAKLFLFPANIIVEVSANTKNKPKSQRDFTPL